MQDITVPLTQNQTTIISPEDSDLAQQKWYAQYRPETQMFYVVHTEHKQTIQLHRVILSRKLGRPLTKGEKCDHKNNDTLDNRRSNLRLATNSQSSQNRRMRKDNTSGYKGVSRTAGKWLAQIRVNKKRIPLGTFDTAEQAYEAYCKAAKKYHKGFANKG